LSSLSRSVSKVLLGVLEITFHDWSVEQHGFAARVSMLSCAGRFFFEDEILDMQTKEAAVDAAEGALRAVDGLVASSAGKDSKGLRCIGAGIVYCQGCQGVWLTDTSVRLSCPSNKAYVRLLRNFQRICQLCPIANGHVRPSVRLSCPYMTSLPHVCHI
jgi:hypothetical protein